MCRSCDYILTHRITYIFPGVIRYNCGECGAYVHHLVDGHVKRLAEDPKPPGTEVTAKKAPKAPAPPKKTAEQKAADKMKKEQAELVKRLAEIRRVLGDAAADSDSLEL